MIASWQSLDGWLDEHEAGTRAIAEFAALAHDIALELDELVEPTGFPPLAMDLTILAAA